MAPLLLPVLLIIKVEKKTHRCAARIKHPLKESLVESSGPIGMKANSSLEQILYYLKHISETSEHALLTIWRARAIVAMLLISKGSELLL